MFRIFWVVLDAAIENVSAPEARKQVSPLWSRAHAKAEGWVSVEKRESPGGATQSLDCTLHPNRTIEHAIVSSYE